MAASIQADQSSPDAKMGSGRRHLVGLLLLSTLFGRVDGYMTINPPSRSRPRAIAQPTYTTPFIADRCVAAWVKSPEKMSDQEEALSDVDSRVLQAMLEDSKVDLNTEADIKKLLERGTVKKTPKESKQATVDASESSEFSSQIFKTLSETKLWQKFSSQASDVLESVGIWVSNKVETDLKTLAALGLFAWDRAVKDVARALPESSSMRRDPFMLTNTSSYEVSPDRPKALMDEMNRPADEIRSVSRAIFDILKGEGSGSTSTRGLRTAAPAGTSGSRERQRRAFQQRKKLDRQEKDVTRVPGAVFDTAYELKRELQAETNAAGYKTEGIRNALKAGTNNLLSAVRESARIAAARRQNQLKEAAPPKIDRALLLERLRNERTKVTDNLRDCVSFPENTWLREEFILGLNETFAFGESELRDVVTTMVFVRDEIDYNVEEMRDSESVELLIFQLRSILKSLDELRARVATATSVAIADELKAQIIFDFVDDDGEASLEGLTNPGVPLILQLDELESSINYSEEFHRVTDAIRDASPDQDGSPPEEPRGHARGQTKASILDVEPELLERRLLLNETYGFDDVDDEEASEVSSFTSSIAFSVEVVSDDDFESAVGSSRSSSPDSAEDESSGNPFIQFFLRSLDVAFFVVEKTFTVAIPKSIETTRVALSRLKDIQQNGRGSTGWEVIRNTADSRGRY